MREIKETFDNLNIQITKRGYDEVRRLVLVYEMRDDHPLALNTPLLGVDKMYFAPKDREELFNIFGLTEKEFASVVKKISTVDSSRNVTGDPFNIFVTYLIHTGLKLGIDHKAIKALIVYLHYKFFTSLIVRRFPLGANADIMNAVIEDLNMKFAIKVEGTWKNLIYNKADSILKRGSLHIDALTKYDNDDKILYFLSDTQTRLRNQINLITSLFHEYKENNDKILSVSSTTTVDGEKIIKESTRGFANVSVNIYSKVLNKRSFIVEKYIQMILSVQKDTTKGLMMKTLIEMSDVAMSQNSDGKTRKVVRKKDGSIKYEGMEVLIEALVESIYKSALADGKVNMNNKMEIFMFVKRMYTSSRIKNDIVLNTKYSIREFIEKHKITRRDTSISSLTVAVPLYVTILSFDALSK